VEFHRVPPGQSVAFARAKKAELVALPPEEKPAPVPGATVPEPTLPDNNVEKIADSFMVGNLCMEQGKYAEAASAYQQAVSLNPNFAEAWNKLAIAYQNLGEDKKAIEAFRKSKAVSLQ